MEPGPEAIVDPLTPARRKPPGALLFLPAALNRGAFLQWLKRIHAWTGFWGALAFLLLGISGFLLNHRDTLKIDTGKPVEVSSVALPVDAGVITSPEALGQWAQTTFHTHLEPRAPREAELKGAKGQPRERFMGQEVTPAEVWRRTLSGSNGAVTVSYTPGSTVVHAVRNEQPVFSFLKNLHKGSGMTVPWVLLIDTFAGALVAMSLTGALLWSRLHGPRLAALGIVATSLILAVFAALPGLI
jgi:uncharacterized protein